GVSPLLRVQLHNELFADILRDIFSSRIVKEFSAQVASIDLQPRERATVRPDGLHDRLQIAAAGPNCDDIARPQLGRRDVDDPVVNHDVSMVDELTGLTTSACES